MAAARSFYSQQGGDHNAPRFSCFSVLEKRVSDLFLDYLKKYHCFVDTLVFENFNSS
jgi:hypothetical protein